MSDPIAADSTDVLAFERAWLDRPQHDGQKVAAIRERFGVGEVHYYQRLLGALRDPEAIAAHPVTARVLRERRDRNKKSRRS